MPASIRQLLIEPGAWSPEPESRVVNLADKHSAVEERNMESIGGAAVKEVQGFHPFRLVKISSDGYDPSAAKRVLRVLRIYKSRLPVKGSPPVQRDVSVQPRRSRASGPVVLVEAQEGRAAFA